MIGIPLLKECVGDFENGGDIGTAAGTASTSQSGRKDLGQREWR